ncbi:MFS drug transporter [Ascosphaera apis ARSEF 7405]|uniref:MFS drug transporter n=1 Tax=Ascosphaera apis ARSEF 7405 TaxID=392613 RepID=A0A168AJX2_9EURO|nr:MFS drug transporter [Ascosphaera apis ARSEF 7405]
MADHQPQRPSMPPREQTITGDYESDHTLPVSEADDEEIQRYRTHESHGSQQPPIEKVRSNFEEDLEGYRIRKVASKTVVFFGPDDPGDPANWSKMRKAHVLIAGMLAVLNSTFGSSIPSGAVPSIAKHYGVTSTIQQVLPISLFLLGYVFGPLICGPLSEAYGRRPLLVIPFCCFALFTMACALTPSWNALLGFRFLLGLFGASPNAVVGGLYADVFTDPKTRGRVMATYMTSTAFGPVIAPAISGYVSTTIGWRWVFWIDLCFNGFTAPWIFLLPETYGPIILKRRAAQLRKETGHNKIVSQFDIEDRRNLKKMAKVTLTRPMRMFVRESIVLFTCLYLALVYAIFYLFFQAYPLIFTDLYGMGSGKEGLMYLPIGGGVAIAGFMFVCYDRIYARAVERNAPWVQIEEYRRLPLACIGGPLYMVALFWLGWTSRADVPWVVPMLSGILFGMGFVLIFMAMLNYLSDAYETFAASAQAMASCARSVLAVVLPLATRPMFHRLGIDWGCSLLAFFSLAMSLIPFAFIKWGNSIRESSKFCQELKQLKEEEQRFNEEIERSGSVVAGDESEEGVGGVDVNGQEVNEDLEKGGVLAGRHHLSS